MVRSPDEPQSYRKRQALLRPLPIKCSTGRGHSSGLSAHGKRESPPPLDRHNRFSRAARIARAERVRSKSNPERDKRQARRAKDGSRGCVYFDPALALPWTRKCRIGRAARTTEARCASIERILKRSRLGSGIPVVVWVSYKNAKGDLFIAYHPGKVCRVSLSWRRVRSV